MSYKKSFDGTTPFRQAYHTRTWRDAVYNGMFIPKGSTIIANIRNIGLTCHCSRLNTSLLWQRLWTRTSTRSPFKSTPTDFYHPPRSKRAIFNWTVRVRTKIISPKIVQNHTIESQMTRICPSCHFGRWQLLDCDGDNQRRERRFSRRQLSYLWNNMDFRPIAFPCRLQPRNVAAAAPFKQSG